MSLLRCSATAGPTRPGRGPTRGPDSRPAAPSHDSRGCEPNSGRRPVVWPLVNCPATGRDCSSAARRAGRHGRWLRGIGPSPSRGRPAAATAIGLAASRISAPSRRASRGAGRMRRLQHRAGVRVVSLVIPPPAGRPQARGRDLYY